jgi:hypothetical protein
MKLPIGIVHHILHDNSKPWRHIDTLDFFMNQNDKLIQKHSKTRTKAG